MSTTTGHAEFRRTLPTTLLRVYRAMFVCQGKLLRAYLVVPPFTVICCRKKSLYAKSEKNEWNHRKTDTCESLKSPFFSPLLKFCSRYSMICVGSQMTLSLWTRTGTSPAGFRCMNHGSLCSLSGRLTSYSSQLRPFSAMARRTWKNNNTDSVTDSRG